MKKEQDLPDADVLNGKAGLFFLLIPNPGLRMLDVPIAKVVPKEAVNAAKDGVELVVLVKLVDFVASLGKTEQNGLILPIDLLGIDATGNRAHARVVDEIPRKEPEPANVPKLVAKISTLLDALLRKPDVLAFGRDAHDSMAQAIRSVFFNQVERVR